MVRYKDTSGQIKDVDASAYHQARAAGQVDEFLGFIDKQGVFTAANQSPKKAATSQPPAANVIQPKARKKCNSCGR